MREYDRYYMFASSDGYVHPPGKSVMCPIPHVFRLTSGRSRIHTWADGCIIMFLYVHIHPLPKGMMQPCTPYLTHTWGGVNERIRTCVKITIKFPDWHSHGSLMTACDTMCHPVTPFRCPDGAGFGYSRSYKDDGERIFSYGRE